MSQVLYPTNYLPHSTSKSSLTATSSKVPIRTEAPADVHNGASSHRIPLTTSDSNNSGSSSSSSALTASRPRRAAALASEAATTAVVETSRRKSSLQSNKSYSNPSSKPTPRRSQPSDTTTQTPKVDVAEGKAALNGSGGQRQEQRVMAALPRSKRPRRGAAPAEDAITANPSQHVNHNGTALNGRGADMTSASSSKAGIMMGIDSALQTGYSNGNVYGGGSHALPNDPYHVSIPISASSSSTSRLGNLTSGSVREVINGQETEVFVIDSNSPPPNNVYNDTEAHSSSARGKRKAIPSPNGAAVATPSAVSASLSTTAAAKRRKKDGAEAGNPTAAMQVYNKNAVHQDYAGAPAASARVNNVASYRGGYNANYNYQSPNGSRWADHPSNYFTERPGQPIDDEEGHYIIREGNLVAHRYAIKNLLGQGTFGKVVRCKDTQRDREVAIKIIRSIQKYTDAAQIEIRVLKALRDNDPRNENKCIHLIDTFSHHNHVCIVSELLGKSVFDFLKENQFFPFPCKDIWSFAKQLLRSVAFLHDLGLVHTDLKPENILLVHNDFDIIPLTKRANARKKRVLRDSEIRLIDFGSATFNDEYHSQVVSTRHYRAPEIILQMGWSFPCDAWSIGCILIEFYTGEALFQTHDNLEHLAMMENVLGPMPDDFRRKAETYRPGYFYAGRLDFPNAQTNKQSRKFVKAMKTIDQTVNSGVAYSKHDQRFIHLLKRLLTFDPAQRIRVDQALKHPYFDLTANEIPP